MTDSKLIFLISQPRSGSTLTQKILGTHSEIYTRSEPWIMLHPLYSLKNKGIEAEYDSHLEKKVTESFIVHLPDGGRAKYIQYMRDMYQSMYNDYLNANNNKIFLDKTPRYYLIIDELNLVFPESKQIILIRNPLAVLSSLIQKRKTLYGLSANRLDLTLAIDNLIKVIENPKKNQYIVYYEDILKEPEKTIQKLCKDLDIDFEEDMTESFLEKTDTWTFGDQKIYDKPNIDINNINKWEEGLSDPQYWRLMYDYLNLLGKEKIDRLGYNYTELLETLKQYPSYNDIHATMRTTVVLEDFLNKDIHKQNDELNNKNKLEILEDTLFELNSKLKNLTTIKTLLNPIQKYKSYKALIKIYHKQNRDHIKEMNK